MRDAKAFIRRYRLLWAFLAFPGSPSLFACAAAQDAVRLAVASNFHSTAERLADLYTERTGRPVVITPGATGALFAQIRAGAPFDVFIAADNARPAALVAAGVVQAEDAKTLAIGRLAVWPIGDEAVRRLEADDFKRLALANPAVAPYGLAAKRALVKAGLWADAEAKIVYGQNVGQAMVFTDRGGADFAIISLAQARTRSSGARAWSSERVPQAAALLKSSSGRASPRTFFDFLFSDEAATLIRKSGYEVP